MYVYVYIYVDLHVYVYVCIIGCPVGGLYHLGKESKKVQIGQRRLPSGTPNSGSANS